MAIGDFISATDYNTIRTKIFNVMSTGSGNYGYGQTTFSSLVSAASASVSKTQWDALRYDIYNALLHQTGTAAAMTQVAVGDIIRYGASQPNFQYDTFADQATSNRFNLGTGQFVTEAIDTKSFSSSWYQSVSSTTSVTFATAEQARFFFNAGGKIRFASTRSGGNGEAQNTAWSNLLSSAGTQSFVGGPSGINFFSLTSGYQTFAEVSGSSAYSNNKWRLEASCNVSSNTLGTANVVNFRITWLDAYTDPPTGGGYSPGSFPPGDLVDGTLTLTVDQVRPAGFLQPSGAFTTIGPASATVGVISGS
jgi:hypothetical protein